MTENPSNTNPSNTDFSNTGVLRTVTFPDREAVADLRTFTSRAAAVDRAGAIRLQAVGTALVSTVRMQDQPIVLGLRVLPLAEPTQLDVVVELASVLDRLARMQSGGAGDPLTLPIPPFEVQARWAGISPPRSGWTETGELPVRELLQQARSGETGVPGAAAGLGFLADDTEVAVVRASGPWTRVSFTRGHLLTRQPLLR